MNAPIKLYGYWRSLATFRVRAALNIKKLAYTEELIDLSQNHQFSEEFSKLNPQNTIPLLQNGDVSIAQSMAILEYIEEVWPQSPLMPKDAAGRAQVRALAQVAIADVHPLVVPRVRSYLASNYGQTEENQAQWARHWIDRGSRAIEEILVDSTSRSGLYAYSDELTLADLALCSHLVGAKLFKADVTPYPRLVEIVNRCLAIPEIAAAHPLKQVGAPPL